MIMTIVLAKPIVTMIPEGKITQHSLLVNQDGRIVITGTKEHVKCTMKSLMGGN